MNDVEEYKSTYNNGGEEIMNNENFARKLGS